MLRPVAARVAVVDHAYRVLLLHVTDPDAPAGGTWWELPELADVPGARLGPCVWVRGRERTSVAWLDDPNAPRAVAVADTGSLLGARWWTLDELAASDARFDPPGLPALMPAVVRGEYGANPLHLR